MILKKPSKGLAKRWKVCYNKKDLIQGKRARAKIQSKPVTIKTERKRCSR
jgi:hypothetical protein